MHDHDLDLIMALAEGTLDASDVTAAEASIAACEQCTRDLGLQQQALAMLGAAPRVGLTAMESARMRRSVRDELGLAAAAQAVAASAVRRRFNWTGALSAAAVLLIVVLAAPTLNLLGGSDDEASTAEDLFAVASPTSTVAAAETTTNSDGSAGGDKAADSSEDLEERALEAPAAAEPTTTVAVAVESGSLRDDLTLEEIALAYASFFEPDTAALYSGAVAPAETDEFDRCAEVGASEIAAQGGEVVEWSFTGLREFEETEQAVITYQLDSGAIEALAHDTETCEVVDRS